jgi:hypothetical protein
MSFQKNLGGGRNKPKSWWKQTAIVHVHIGKVLLDRYYSDDRFLRDAQEREKIFKDVEFFTK